ncbi:MAG: ABC transporter permease subunit, partial [Gemmatimonadales bacterium]
LFSWPGLGTTIVSAALTNDQPLMLGIVLVMSVSVMLANLAADLVCAWIDPRIRNA